MNYWKDVIADTILPSISVIILGSSYRNLTAAFKIMFFYILAGVITFSITNILADNQINNLFLYHLFTPLNTLFISLFLKKSFLSGLSSKIILIVNIIVFAAALANVYFFENIKTMDVNMGILSNFFILCLCLISFFYALMLTELVEVIRLSHFIFLFGIFIYAAASIIIYSYFKYKNYQGKEMSNSLWFFHDNILIAKNIFFILASSLCIRNK